MKTVSVIIPTYNRPDCIRTNLERLAEQEPRPDQVIVIDASPDDRTERVVAEFEGVLYLRNAAGRGNTPNSRNMGLRHATGQIIAFLDDDAFVHEGWLRSLVEPYDDPAVGGVAGRALNGVRGEAEQGADRIGRLLPNGTMTGNFAADPGRIVEVDHMIGCNMSLRARVIAELGGFRDDFRAGPFGICEETEICVRAKRAGWRLVFNPAACADHIGAPQPNSRRFGPKYSYYHTKNNLVMVIRNFGMGAMAARYCLTVGGRSAAGFVRKIGGAVAHLAATVLGLAVGLVVGCGYLVRCGRGPARQDEGGKAIREALSAPQERDSEKVNAA